MNVVAIFWWVGLAVLVLAASMLLPALACLIVWDMHALSAFALSFMICVVIGGGFLLISANRIETSHVKAGIREITMFLMIWWGAIPVIAGLPFMLDSMTLADAWFESVSAITTTGAWLSAEEARENYAMMLWRAQLQWLGGIVSISAAAAVFVRPQFIGIDIVNTPFARGEDESFLRAFRTAIYTFFPAYCLISLGIFVLFVATGTPADDAFIIAISFTASGGFLPQADGLASYGQMVPFAAFLSLVAGGISFVSAAKFMAPYDKALRFRDDRETPVFLILVVAIAFIYSFSTYHHLFEEFGTQLLNAASMLSTNGIVFGHAPAPTPALITAMIGGASISAAGGIKLIRWLVTFERAGEEIWKLIHPRGILGKAKAVNELGVWVHFVAFTIILSNLVLIITIFGNPLELSVTTAVAVISNAGPMISIAPGEVVDYDSFHPQLRLILAFGMIIGRVEMVVALAVLNRTFWRS